MVTRGKHFFPPSHFPVVRKMRRQIRYQGYGRLIPAYLHFETHWDAPKTRCLPKLFISWPALNTRKEHRPLSTSAFFWFYCVILDNTSIYYLLGMQSVFKCYWMHWGGGGDNWVEGVALDYWTSTSTGHLLDGTTLRMALRFAFILKYLALLSSCSHLYNNCFRYFYSSAYLSIYLSVCLSICLSITLFAHVSSPYFAHFSIRLYVC